MKIYELEESAQQNINIDDSSGGGSGKKKMIDDDGPVFDKTDIGQRISKKRKGVFNDVQLI